MMTMTVREVAAETRTSTRYIWGLLAASPPGIPEPIRRGRVVRWRRADIERWIEAGMPNVDELEQLHQGAGVAVDG